MDGKPKGSANGKFLNQFQRRCWFGFVAVLLQRSIMYHKPLMMHEFNNCNHGCLLANAFGVSAANLWRADSIALRPNEPM